MITPLLWKFLLQEIMTKENIYFFPSNSPSDVKCKNKNGNVIIVYSGRALSYLANSQADHSNMETITIVSPLEHIVQLTFVRTTRFSASKIQK